MSAEGSAVRIQEGTQLGKEPPNVLPVVGKGRICGLALDDKRGERLLEAVDQLALELRPAPQRLDLAPREDSERETRP